MKRTDKIENKLVLERKDDNIEIGVYDFRKHLLFLCGKKIERMYFSIVCDVLKT